MRASRCSSRWKALPPAPKNHPRGIPMQHCRLIKMPKAGHWIHHDQLGLFLRLTKAFLEL
jgi:pimeloyl-ACP methyl ester carboxylesterase